MKCLLKTIALINLATYFYLLFFSCVISKTIDFHEIQSSKEIPITFLVQPIANVSDTNFNTQKEIKFEKTVKPAIFNYKHIENLSNFQSAKKYFQTTDLHYNLPLICYKFPLSEYTEEG